MLAGTDDHLTRLSPVILNLESTGLTHLESEIRVKILIFVFVVVVVFFIVVTRRRIFPLCDFICSSCCVFCIVRFHWLQFNQESLAILSGPRANRLLLHVSNSTLPSLQHKCKKEPPCFKLVYQRRQTVIKSKCAYTDSSRVNASRRLVKIGSETQMKFPLSNSENL